jgi:tetratricopeptide (TPR) repeat protein
MHEIMSSAWNNYIASSEQMLAKFALISGTERLSWNTRTYGYSKVYETLRRESTLYETLRRESTLYEISEQVQFVLWTLQERGSECLSRVCEQLNDAIDASPGIPVRLVLERGTAMLYPMGAGLLDEAVIENNLAWLEKYSDAAKAFQEALRLYTRKDPNNYRNLLDNLRVSVEQVLKAVLNNQRSLEHQKEDFLRWLSAHDAHSQIRNIYHDLLFGKFAQYQNDAVKHNEDKYTAAEVEFMLYLTGTLLRFVQRASETVSPRK